MLQKNIIGDGFRHYEVSVRARSSIYAGQRGAELANSKVHGLTLITRDQAACRQ